MPSPQLDWGQPIANESPFNESLAVLLLAGCTQPTSTSTPIKPSTTTPQPISTSTPASGASTTSTPIPTPKSSFRIDNAKGSAPLAVQFVNDSINATSYHWEFGDGTSSVDPNPRHTYTKAGKYAVRLEVRSDLGGRTQSDVLMIQDAVEVRPGPLASLSLKPQRMELDPLAEARFEVAAEDEFGNEITDFVGSWATASSSGVIDPSGWFKAGIYSEGVTLQANYGGVSKQVSAVVVILPGPIATANLEPASAAIFTGDVVSLSVDVLDAFGNVISPITTGWSTSVGTIQGVGTKGTFQAGRQPGPAAINVEVTDRHGTAQGHTTIQVNQGYCEAQLQKTQWRVQWYETTDAGSRGQRLGEQILPAAINLSTWGEVFGGRSGNLQMEGEMKIVVQRTGPVSFTMSGDDGFRLHLEDTLLIDEWRSRAERTRTVTYLMEPGIYFLKLQYFEGIGKAVLKFSTDADVVEWTEATKCFGGYAELPLNRYFVYSTSGEGATKIAQRFNVPLEEVAHLAGVLQGQVVISGARARHKGPKVVVIQGIDSKSSCQDAMDTVSSDTFFARLNVLLRDIQIEEFVTFEQVSLVDASDVIGFSYSGQYQDCSTGLVYTEMTYPVKPSEATIQKPGIRQIRDMVLPVYDSQDTCNGVNFGAQRLAQLIQGIVNESPDSPIVLAGHSMGGMVATYYLSTMAAEYVQDRIQAVITIDSPLQSTTLKNPLSSCLSTDAVWRDIAGETDVVSKIADLRTSSGVSKLFAINSTQVGGYVPGSYFWKAGCAGSGGLLAGLLSSLICPLCAPAFIIGGAAIDLQAGHSCAFYDDSSLAKISAVVNGEEVSGFSKVIAIIENLDGISKIVQTGSQETIAFTFTNTGNVSWVFGAIITIRRASGLTSNLFDAVTLASGETRTVSFPVLWGEVGSRDIRVIVCSETSAACRTRLADTGWLLSYISVQP